jgi:ferritin-like metal-binding protein YciE
MNKINNLKALLIEQARELYNAEIQQINTLLYLKNHTGDAGLRKLIAAHLKETETQTNRFKDIFEILEVSSFGEKSKVMKGIIEESVELVDRCEEAHIKDAAIIVALQNLKHFEIAGYGTICSFANILGLKEVEAELHLSLLEEKEMDKMLSKLARESVNVKAVSPIMISSL